MQPLRRRVKAAELDHRGCSFSFSVADGDASTCIFAEFSSKWRTRFSHLRGGSYNRTVVPERYPSGAAGRVLTRGDRAYRRPRTF